MWGFTAVVVQPTSVGGGADEWSDDEIGHLVSIALEAFGTE